MNPIRLNQILYFVVQSSLIASFFILLNWKLSLWAYVLLFFVNMILLHYHLNLVHMASHGLLGKSRLVNSFLGNMVAIFGGVTFADFKTTHALHHAKVATKGDPDMSIATTQNFLFMPFKIWHHDRFFWTHGLWKKDRNWLGYIIDRTVQVGIVLAFFLTGNIFVWQFFWLVPELCVGILNGMFLFYFPHFTTNFELNLRKYLAVSIHTYSLPNFAEFVKNKGMVKSLDHLKYNLGKFCLEMINVSRMYHEKHHLKPRENLDYYPLEHFLILNFNGLWPKFVAEQNLKADFTDIYGPMPRN